MLVAFDGRAVEKLNMPTWFLSYKYMETEPGGLWSSQVQNNVLYIREALDLLEQLKGFCSDLAENFTLVFSVAKQLDLINKEVELYKGRIDQQKVQNLAVWYEEFVGQTQHGKELKHNFGSNVVTWLLFTMKIFI